MKAEDHYESADKQEEYFWDTLYEQMGDQVSVHIAKFRDVQTIEYLKTDSLDDYMEKDREIANAGIYRDQVSFSAYPEDYTNNLEEVAIEGRVQFKSDHQSFFGGMAEEFRKDYESEILENPTWLDLCLCCNDMINCTGDNHHIFLEGVHKTGSFTLDDKSFILIYDFSTGS